MGEFFRRVCEFAGGVRGLSIHRELFLRAVDRREINRAGEEREDREEMDSKHAFS